MAVVSIAAGGCELRGEKQDKSMYGKSAAKKKSRVTTTTTTPKTEPPKAKTPPKTKKPPRRVPPRKISAIEPKDIKWEPYEVADAGLTFDSFGKKTVREIKRNKFVATSQAPLNAFIFYSGKHTYDKEAKRYEGRPKIKLSAEKKVKVCGQDARRREVNTGTLTAVLTGFKHKNTEMMAVWRVPTNLRAKYAAAEKRFLNSFKCK